MKLASHNSMTYLPPKKWYMYLFRFAARCQNKTIEEQYEQYGIRMFDLRISFLKNGLVEFRHGLIAYKGDVKEILNYLNTRDEKVYVRFILESDNNCGELRFIHFCNWCLEHYTNIIFFEGVLKKNWKQLVNFGTTVPTYDHKYASNNNPINYTGKTRLDDLYPWIYAKLFNRKNIKKGTDKEYLFLDFVNIQ